MAVPTVPQPPAQQAEPAFAGSVEEYIALHTDAATPTPAASPLVSSMLLNKVKKCQSCGKPNGFTLVTCNQCGSSLAATAVSFTPNVFMGFTFGIGKAPFPLTISIRAQSTDILVFDDLLALSPLHLNAIPTTQFIPDWRYLLRRPREGLAVIDALLAQCQSVANEQFLSDGSEWKRAFVRSSSSSPFEASAHMCYGFNYPPSQSQLHLQYICPNVMPFQYAQFLNGVHFTVGRFFPFTYVRRCLELLIRSGAATPADDGVTIPVDLLGDDTDVSAIIRYFSDVHQHDYLAAHALYCKRFADLAEEYSNWDQQWFEGRVVPVGGGAGIVLATESSAASVTEARVDVSEVAASDKLLLQSYGRPYAATGRPTGSYYAFPKTPGDIVIW